MLFYLIFISFIYFLVSERGENVRKGREESEGRQGDEKVEWEEGWRERVCDKRNRLRDR